MRTIQRWPDADRLGTRVSYAGGLMTAFARTGAKAAVLAVVCATALAACGSSGSGGNVQLTPSGAFGKVPAQTGTPHAGTITVAEPPNATPTWIFPVTPGANGSVYTAFSFQAEMWRYMYMFPDGAKVQENKAMSLASDPVWSNGDKTVSVTLKNWKWSDGQPITAKDAEFFIDLTKAAVSISPADYSQYVPKIGIPDQVTSILTPNSQTLVLNLNKPVNPTWFFENELAGIIPLPVHAWAKASASGPVLDFTNPANAKKIYQFLAGQSKSTGSYASNPLWQVVDGPYKLTSFNNTTGAYSMTPNTSYSGPHASKQSTLQAVPFTSDTAEFNAVKSGKIDQGYVPFTDLPQVASIEHNYNVFGYPGFGFNYVTYNFKDTTGDFNNIIKQLYFRQAFAHLENEVGYVHAFFHGAGGLDFGPVPQIPPSPYTPANATTNPYPFSVSTAVSILKAHGWTVNPGGTDVCSSPGTGSNQCGAGIPAGTKLAFNLIWNTSPAIIGQQITDLANQAKKAGINITLKSDNFNHMIATYYDVAAPKNDNLWAMEDFGGFSIASYPTMNGIFNSTGTYNIGGYADSKADQLILASTTSSNPAAVKAEASYLTQQQPSLFQPAVDNIEVWSKSISGPPEAFESLTQYQLSPEFWYFTK
jgi:peptide/nickel transport system substrate-binding protein